MAEDKGKSATGDPGPEITDQIVSKIFEKIKNKLDVKTNAELLNLVDDENTEYAIKNIIHEKYMKHTKLKIRYVPPNHIVNFSNSIDKYSPYGTSIFDGIMMPGRLYLLGLLSSVISRLNRAAVIRKWTLEVGAHKNHSEIVERFKRQLRNKSVSSADIMSGNVREIAQQFSDYDDIVTVQQNGKRFLDMELMPLHDRQMPVNELQQLKDELLASTGIPSIYLDSQNAVSLREELVQVNVQFANLINSYQTVLNERVSLFVDNIFKIILDYNNIDPDIFMLSRYIEFKLVPPTLLVLQHLEGTVSSVTNLTNLLTQQGIQVDPVWFLDKFIKIVDWKAVQQAGEEYNNKKQIENAQGQSGGGMGGY
jgi:hypothetical protein